LAENVADTLFVICFADSVAGFSEQGQGPPSTNPVLCLRVSAAALPVAVAEPSPPSLRHIAGATILPAAALDGRQLYDALGRRVGRPGSGVYFARSAGGLRRVVVLFPNRR
jgi:hypothetical protein